jgi:hypothetical protein
VARGLIPNQQAEYKRLGDIVSLGRRVGLIDWSAIVDRTRSTETPVTWGSPREIVAACGEQFAIDLWEDQPRRVTVMVEKEALAGVMEVACRRYQLPYLACRGYPSDSEAWASGRRFREQRRHGQDPLVLHLGYHDPSGIDMTRDLQEKLGLFAGRPVEVKRIALNMDQVDAYRPPANPAKKTDSRFKAYAALYGNESWELDALDPPVLTTLIHQEVEAVLDGDLWGERERVQEEGRSDLAAVAAQWDRVTRLVQEDE